MRGDSRGALAVLVVALVVFHFLLRLGFGLGVFAPDLLVVALLVGAREMRAGPAAGLGLLLGILDGAVIPFALGNSAVVLTILGFVGSRTRQLVAGDSLSFLALYLFVGKWLFDALLAGIGWLFPPHIAVDLGALLLVSPLAALYAAVVGVAVVAVYRLFT